MKDIFKKKHLEFYVDSPTNQQFVIIANEQVAKLDQIIGFTHFGQSDRHHTICRFVTSWTTTDEELDELEKALS